jgi:diguanylate cyclase (GGDEF)-like protein/PAS domain S-box-containing protein
MDIDAPDTLARQSASRLRLALDAAHAGTWEWDARTGRSQWSDEVYRLYGLEPGSQAASYDAWLQAVRPEDRGEAARVVRSAVERQDEIDLEWRVDLPAGRIRWLQLRGKPEHAGAGRSLLYRGIVMDVTQRKLAELALRESEQRYRSMFQISPDALAINRLADGLYVDVNEGFCRHFGWTEQEIIGRTSRDIGIWRDPADRARLIAILERDGLCRNFETTLLTKDGRARAVLVSSRAITLQGEKCLLTVTHDISDRKQIEDQLRKLSQAVEQSPESIIIANPASQIEYVNQAFCRNSGYQSAEVVGKTPEFLDSGKTRPEVIAGLREAMKAGRPWQGEFHNRRKDGSEYTEFAVVAPIRNDAGEVTSFVAVQQDITERVLAERKIQQLAFYDQLTGLPNRTLLQDRLRQAATACVRTGAHGVLMMIDLDHFKLLNDTLGHDFGDELLKQVATRVGACVRRGDTLARLGGDEFMLVMGSLPANAEEAATYAQGIARKILAALQGDFELDGVAHHCSASIGVTLFDSDRTSNDELMKQADLAMYKAKERGRDAVCFFDPQMESAVRQRSALEKDLRRALEERQFLLLYQPQVDMDGRIFGVEALVRWRHPQRGLVAPAEFIPVAEETGLILPLGREIFDLALAQMARWSRHPSTAHLSVAVNVSARQIRQADFVDQVLDALARSGAPASLLELELTESLLIDNAEDIIGKMSALKERGVGFSLDDFGTGFSSLTYLKRLPLDQLKIDQSFVRDVLTDANDAAIARTIVALAASLGLGVLAEGVETEAQRRFLANAGCGAYQGYLFSRPVEADAVAQLVERRIQHAL